MREEELWMERQRETQEERREWWKEYEERQGRRKIQKEGRRREAVKTKGGVNNREGEEKRQEEIQVSVFFYFFLNKLNLFSFSFSFFPGLDSDVAEVTETEVGSVWARADAAMLWLNGAASDFSVATAAEMTEIQEFMSSWVRRKRVEDRGEGKEAAGEDYILIHGLIFKNDI